MESNTPNPSGPTGGGQDLFGAIREASDHLGVRSREPGASPSPPDAPSRRRWVPIALFTLLLGSALAVTLLLESRVPQLEPHRVEADLRWAVAELVEEIHRQSSILGRLPFPADLPGLLGDAIEYTPSGGTFLVVGSRNGIRVEFDGRIPLDAWRALVLYPPDSP